MKIAAKDQIHFYKAEHIVRFEHGTDNVSVYLKNGNTEHIDAKIDQLSSDLEDQGFIRVHPDHLININCITQICGHNADFVKLVNGDMIPLLPEAGNQLMTLLEDHI
ncbi:LytTR family transcriptional regulator DNA-binding domain-containing protein [Saccharicrinis sp. FJH54]|uniref:LytTR family transcriptional regulator DNA-binding domain-containing protein n=1 Tax=Saccharicrinis sp. FJH54 TaxID=3344665 RepID=UPI0035D4968C